MNCEGFFGVPASPSIALNPQPPACLVPGCSYYPFETVVLGKGSVLDGLRRYVLDAPEALTTYWKMWPGVHAISFGLMPKELRISFVASVSFVWLIFLSTISHREEAVTEAER